MFSCSLRPAYGTSSFLFRGHTVHGTRIHGTEAEYGAMDFWKSGTQKRHSYGTDSRNKKPIKFRLIYVSKT